MNLLDDDEIIDFDSDINADSFELPTNPLSRKIPVVQDEEFQETEEEFLDDEEELINEASDDEEVFEDDEDLEGEEDLEDEENFEDEKNLEGEEDFEDDEDFEDEEDLANDEYFDDEDFEGVFGRKKFDNKSSYKEEFYDESYNYKTVPKKTFHYKRFRDEELFDDNDVYDSSSTKNKKRSSEKTRQHKKRLPGSVLTWVLAFTTLCSLGLCVYMLIDAHNKTVAANSIIIENPPIEFTQEEIDQLTAEAADQREQEIKQEIQNQLAVANPNVAEMLRQLYSDHVIYYDSEGYHFIPILDSIGRNGLVRNNFFVAEDGEITYQEQGTVISVKGIDVSQHQGSIDWEQVAASGVNFAIIRAGYRGYGSGVLVTDERFEENITGALNAGLPVGAYFFTQAITVEEALEEADYVINLLSPYEITYPVVIDVEKPDSDEARANPLSREERTAIVCAFCDAIRDAGYTPMIYGNTQSLFGMLDIEQISEYKIWHAFYNDYVYYPYQLQIWQYTASATVPGVTGAVDLNIWFPE